MAVGQRRYEWLYVYGFVRPGGGEVQWLIFPEVDTDIFAVALKYFAEAVGVDDLTSRPLCRRVCGDVEVYDLPAIEPAHNQPEEDSEGGCGHDEEVQRHEVLEVVVQERSPGG